MCDVTDSACCVIGEVEVFVDFLCLAPVNNGGSTGAHQPGGGGGAGSKGVPTSRSAGQYLTNIQHYFC